MKFIWPLADHYITRGFDYKSSIYIGGMHAALDLIRRLGATRASPILSVAAGTIAGVGWDTYSGFFAAADLDEGGWQVRYRHMYGQPPVTAGQHVQQGQIIGNVGNTGWSTGDHLHFDLWHRQKQDDTAFSKSGWWAHNPELYLGQEADMAFTAEQKQEIRDIIFGHSFIAKDKQGGNISGSHNLVRWMGIVIEHKDDAAKHSAGGVSRAVAKADALTIAKAEDNRLKVTK